MMSAPLILPVRCVGSPGSTSLIDTTVKLYIYPLLLLTVPSKREKKKKKVQLKTEKIKFQIFQLSQFAADEQKPAIWIPTHHQTKRLVISF